MSTRAVTLNTYLFILFVQYGRNIGIAFQLVDDLLDFVASADQLGKYSSLSRLTCVG